MSVALNQVWSTALHILLCRVSLAGWWLTLTTLSSLSTSASVKAMQKSDRHSSILESFTRNAPHDASSLFSFISPHARFKQMNFWWNLLPLLAVLGVLLQYYQRRKALGKPVTAKRRQRSNSSVQGSNLKGMLHRPKLPLSSHGPW